MPRSVPTIPWKRDSRRNSLMMKLSRAPRHFIVPISRNRSVTLMSMALRMPTKATSRARLRSKRVCVRSSWLFFSVGGTPLAFIFDSSSRRGRSCSGEEFVGRSDAKRRRESVTASVVRMAMRKARARMMPEVTSSERLRRRRMDFQAISTALDRGRVRWRWTGEVGIDDWVIESLTIDLHADQPFFGEGVEELEGGDF